MFEEDVAALSESIHAQHGALTDIAQVFHPIEAKISLIALLT
ncbi:hypothetical protein [Bradyrhizobium barranii]|nr:hypothetical protein [Bradyrhizobium japonicum]